MTIDTTGTYWKGSKPSDIEAYLKAFSEEGYPTHDFRLACCSCGSMIFKVNADQDEGAVQRTCVDCGKEHLVCDSDEYWDEAEPEKIVCDCGSKQFNLGVGFSFYKDTTESKWLYVGVRCSNCKILGCVADWKVGYEPSKHLLDRV